jgi:pyrophosphatase PpaX
MQEAYTPSAVSRHPAAATGAARAGQPFFSPIRMTPSRLPAPDVVLFDVDGTLVDSYRLYLESYRRAVEPVIGRRPTIEEIAARAASAERHFLLEWIGEERVAECHDALCRHYAELHGVFGDGPYEGVREMLAGLGSAGLLLGIVTGKGRRLWEVTEPILPADLFSVVLTEDDVQRPKPDPEGLITASRILAVPPERIAYVGDSVADLEAGRAAGMRVGAALWPKTESADRAGFLAAAARLAPDWLFERPADVTRMFAGWC